jgi:aspartate/methionine/tyrosine aminotransferase
VTEAVLSRLSWPLTYPPPYQTSGVATALAQYYWDAHRLSVPEDAFRLSTGCLSQSYQVFASLLSPGDEVLYWRPAFKHVPGAVAAAGGIPVPVPTVDWLRSLQAAAFVRRFGQQLTILGPVDVHEK